MAADAPNFGTDLIASSCDKLVHDGLMPVKIGVQVSNRPAPNGEQAACKPFQKLKIATDCCTHVILLQPC